MHDYQLERLNTRSFEQLIQALGTEILGPQLMIFGDGPGRRAREKLEWIWHRAGKISSAAGFRGEEERRLGDSPEISQALERIDDMSEELPPVRARRYPLRVDLKHLAASLASTAETGSNNLFDYLIKRIATRTHTTVRAQAPSAN